LRLKQKLISQDADVVLLHGLGRTAQIMTAMDGRLVHEGYRTYNLDYPSTRYPIEALADQIAGQLQALRPDPHRVLHWVVHSMGALVAHFCIQKHRPLHLGRVVALGPPYHGSAIIDHLAKYRWYEALHGPAALQLTTQPQGICHRLGSIDYELGVIAGDRYFFTDWFFSHYWLQRPNDGKVEVASTRVAGYRDHLVLPVNHIFLPQYPIVTQQAAYFLAHGHFQFPSMG
jgi:triacylglycerol lipase